MTATDGAGNEYSRRITLFSGAAVDRDQDGLIEIDNLAMLDNMRHDLAGASYKTGEDSTGSNAGCPATGCIGYELTGHLDFDADGDGSSWSEDGGGYLLDTGDSRAPHFVVASAGTGGWRPIGDESNPFTAVFDGNGYSIRHLASHRDQTFVGFFGVIAGNAVVRNIGLVANLANSSSSSSNGGQVGGLVGWLGDGSITASYATGPAVSVVGEGNSAGGLVGLQTGGSITASYATGPVAIGGGANFGFNDAGGLVGYQSGGSITASYATGLVVTTGGDDNNAAGLVGQLDGGSITASYATGPVVNSGPSSNLGVLVAEHPGGPITDSYGFGAITGSTARGSGTPPSGVSLTVQLTASNAGSSWNAAANRTSGAWDFGTASQPPLLRYADYDGTGTDFDCSQFPGGVCGALVPGQLVVAVGEDPPRGVRRGVDARRYGAALRFDRPRRHRRRLLALAAAVGPARLPERRRQPAVEFHGAERRRRPGLRADRRRCRRPRVRSPHPQLRLAVLRRWRRRRPDRHRQPDHAGQHAPQPGGHQLQGQCVGDRSNFRLPISGVHRL